MRNPFWFLRGLPRLATVVSFGLCSLSLIGCGGSSKTSTTDKPSAATAASDVKSLLEKATAALQQRQWKSALETLTEAIKLDPKCSEAYFQRASLLADAGQAQAAAHRLHQSHRTLAEGREAPTHTRLFPDDSEADRSRHRGLYRRHRDQSEAHASTQQSWVGLVVKKRSRESSRGLQSGLADRTKICRVADQSRLRGVSVETTQTGNRRL